MPKPNDHERHEKDTQGPLDHGRRIYLGFAIHGRKRTDLAMKNDPNFFKEKPVERQLVFQAAMNGAHEVLKYLHGSRPLSAYRHFASTSIADPRARHLQRIADLSTALPPLLGWQIDDYNESPLSAAVFHSWDVKTVNLLLEISPKLMQSALKAK